MVAGALVQYVLANALFAELKARQRLGRLVRGIVLFLGGGLLAGGVLIFVLLGIFFKLADMPELVWPSLVTGLIGLLVALLLIWEGWRSITNR